MKIKVRNNKSKIISNVEAVKVVEYYLKQLLGDDVDTSKLGISLVFKKLSYYRGGYCRTFGSTPNIFDIAVNSTNTIQQQLSTIAHECVHVKQYFTGELRQTLEFSRNGRAKHVRTWKGKKIVRCAYQKRPWEVEARKYQDKLSANVLNKINKPEVKAEPKPLAIPTEKVCTIEAQVLNILSYSELPNGELSAKVLQGKTDKQLRLRVLKEIFRLKQDKKIEEVNRNGLIFVRAI